MSNNHTGPWDMDAKSKYGDNQNIYCSPASSNAVANGLSCRRGAAVAFSSLPDTQTGSTTPTYFIPSPIPMVGISSSPNRNKHAFFNNDYTISLNGYIVPSGDPNNPTAVVGRIFSLQRKMINVLNGNDLYVHVQTAQGSSGVLSFPCIVENVSFDPGPYTNNCSYSVTLKSFAAHSGYRTNDFADGLSYSFYQNPALYNVGPGKPNLNNQLIEDYTEDLSYEYVTDFGMGQALNPNSTAINAYDVTEGYYKVNRTVNIVGRDIYNRRRTGGFQPRLAWEHALDIAQQFTNNLHEVNQAMTSGLFPYKFDGTKLNANNVVNYECFNFEVSTNINKAAGSVQLSQSWILLPSGLQGASNGSQSLENYSTSISTESESSYVSVSIEGTIKGLSKMNQMTGPNYLTVENTSGKFANALSTYTAISSSGEFGYCHLFKRAQAGVQPTLNTQPLSVSVSQNRALGEITYNITYDNRPTNFFRGVHSEQIEIQDTYPGDLYTLVNVIGRPTGPVIQYGAGRTEYRRNVSINLVLGHPSINNRGGDRRSLIYSKPSVAEPFRQDLKTLLRAVSPATEPGIRRYFADPPQETWNPSNGNYSLQLSWVYELSE